MYKWNHVNFIADLELYNDIAEECKKEVAQNLTILTRKIRNSCVVRF